MKELTEEDKAKFYASYRITKTCMPWVKSKDKDGYGIFHANGKKYKAHRLAFLLFNGQDPKELCVCHTCDNPSCINPSHLFLGTQLDNIQDRHTKGRSKNKSTPGESHNMAKLTNEQVLYIRSSSLKGSELAKELEVSQATISVIRNRKKWTHI